MVEGGVNGRRGSRWVGRGVKECLGDREGVNDGFPSKQGSILIMGKQCG